jgi:tRNA dimethylallyltransferase
MQVYRGMDVGTAKPDARARATVPHHLVDIAEPSDDLTVAEFQALGRSAIEDIARRGALPLLVGGSGLYFRALVDELEFPPRSKEARAALEREAEEVGAEALHERLAKLDPSAAAKIDPANARRTIRALEVIEITGRPFSDNDALGDHQSIYDLVVVGLSRPRDQLVARIERRVDEMLQRGLVEESHRLAQAGMSRTARQALGYRQVLDAPDVRAEEIRAAIVKATSRFARRQESWWRADPRVKWYDAGEPGLARSIVAYFKEALRLP